MDVYDYDYYDLAAFTGRQNDPGIDILHTIGQLLAAFGPVFAGPIVGAVVALLGIAVIGVANGLYQEDQNRRNIEAAEAAAAATASAAAASTSSSSIVTVNPGPYSITCAYTATGLDTSKITSATCTITLPDTTTEMLTFSGTDTSVTSTAKYTAGAYMTDVTVITMDGTGPTQVDWDVDAQSVTISSNDVTVDHTMTNSGPYKLTCSISATGYDLSVTSGESARTCTVTAVAPSTFTGSPLTLTIPVGMTSVTSEPLFSSGTTISVDADIDVTAGSVTWDTDATEVTLTSDSQVDLSLTNSGPYQIGCTVSILGVDLSTAATTTDNCVIKDSGGVTQETIDLTSGSGTGAMYYTAGIYTLEGTVVTGGKTYTGTTTIIVNGDTTGTVTLGDAGPYMITCAPTISGIDLTSTTTTSGSCVVTDTSGTSLETITIPSGSASATGIANLGAGTYTVSSTIVISGQTYTGSSTETITDMSITSTPTLVNQGPFDITCSLSVTGLDIATCAASCVSQCFITGSMSQTITITSGMSSGTSTTTLLAGTYTVVGRLVYTQTDGSLAVYTGSGSTTITNSDETVSLTLTNARRRSLFDFFNLKSAQEEFYPYFAVSNLNYSPR